MESRIRRPDADETLRVVTLFGAEAIGLQQDLGSIEPGKLADLVVIDRDYLTCREDDIKEIAPVMTIVGGHVAYSR
jgi:predicted amidohydrolase YtcJ